ncbi:MAG: hypothetical protein MUF00_09610, partial [Gemmatimonadaceae bacterium]|nr:hypothetical protein [Gemmatimonadaceae bacterium]
HPTIASIVDARSASPPSESTESAKSKKGPDFFSEVLDATRAEAIKVAATSLASTGALGDAVAAGLHPGTLIGAMGRAALEGLADLGVAQLANSLFGDVSDASSMEEQLAAKFAPIVVAQLQQPVLAVVIDALKGGSGTNLAKDLSAFFTGVESHASVRLGQATVAEGPFLVSASGKAALRVGDSVADDTGNVGTYANGNPAILLNGKAAIGEDHIAIGYKGPMSPKHLADQVLMGRGASDASSSVQRTPAELDAEYQQINPTLDPAKHMSWDPEIGWVNTPMEGVVGAPDTWRVPEPFDPGALLGTLLGFENVPSAVYDPILQQSRLTDTWTVLWGNVSLGSPEQPRAGDAGMWWLPDAVFGYDMGAYYYVHDIEFDSDRSLAQLDRILGAEYTAFVAGLQPDPVHLGLQIVFSSATLTAGVLGATKHSLSETLGLSRRRAGS